MQLYLKSRIFKMTPDLREDEPRMTFIQYFGGATEFFVNKTIFCSKFMKPLYYRLLKSPSNTHGNKGL